jgi:hypothetical protein
VGRRECDACTERIRRKRGIEWEGYSEGHEAQRKIKRRPRQENETRDSRRVRSAGEEGE